jgi:hypothetical protein
MDAPLLRVNSAAGALMAAISAQWPSSDVQRARAIRDETSGSVAAAMARCGRPRRDGVAFKWLLSLNYMPLSRPPIAPDSDEMP